MRDIETVLARVAAALHQQAHPLYRRLAETRASDRKIRSDGLANLHSVIHVMVTHAIIGRWMIGQPRRVRDGLSTLYDRWSVDTLDHRAFGDAVPCERSIRRTWRAMRTLRDAGLLVSHQVSRIRPGPAGDVRAEVAFRFLTADFFESLGLARLLKAGAMRADRTRAEARQAVLAMLRERPRFIVPTHDQPAPLKHDVPRPPPAQPYSDVASEQAAQIWKILA